MKISQQTNFLGPKTQKPEKVKKIFDKENIQIMEAQIETVCAQSHHLVPCSLSASSYSEARSQSFP